MLQKSPAHTPGSRSKSLTRAPGIRATAPTLQAPLRRLGPINSILSTAPNLTYIFMALRIAICDDHPIILESLGLLIATMPDMEVVATFNHAHPMQAYLRQHEVDVLITDLTMPDVNGIELTMALREQHKRLPILMLTVEENHQLIKAAFNAGISGYVLKKAGRTELEKAIRTVSTGEKYISNIVFEELLNAHEEEDSKVLPSQLTAREIEIVKLIAQEFSSAEIARLLFLSPGTVETHRHNIIKKLQVKNVVGITKFAIRNGLI